MRIRYITFQEDFFSIFKSGMYTAQVSSSTPFYYELLVICSVINCQLVGYIAETFMDSSHNVLLVGVFCNIVDTNLLLKNIKIVQKGSVDKFWSYTTFIWY